MPLDVSTHMDVFPDDYTCDISLPRATGSWLKCKWYTTVGVFLFFFLRGAHWPSG